MSSAYGLDLDLVWALSLGLAGRKGLLLPAPL